MWRNSGNSRYFKLRRPSQKWTVSGDSVKRYVTEASDKLVEKLLNDHRHRNLPTHLNEWEPLMIDEGVEISHKKQTVRGSRTFRVPLSAFEGLANTVNTAKVWDPALVEGSRLQADLAKDVDIVFLAFSELAGHSILRGREFLLYETRKAVDDRTYVVGVASLPKRLGRAILAESRKRIRGKLELGWVIQMLDDNRSCNLTCSVQVNPRGWMPRWWVNKRRSKLVLVINHIFILAVNKWLESLCLPEVSNDSCKDI